MHQLTFLESHDVKFLLGLTNHIYLKEGPITRMKDNINY